MWDTPELNFLFTCELLGGKRVNAKRLSETYPLPNDDVYVRACALRETAKKRANFLNSIPSRSGDVWLRRPNMDADWTKYANGFNA